MDAKQRGQASVELLAALPTIALAGAIALQLLLTGYALTLADGAAEAGALALAAGRPARVAVEESLPGWAAHRAKVVVRGGGVTVRLRPPSLLPLVGDRLAIESSGYARRK
jgi:hypothetical protein